MKKFFSLAAILVLLAAMTTEKLNAQCLPAWFYKRSLTVTNQSALTYVGMQVKLSINTAAIVSAGKMNAAGNDIRFTDASCNLLPYWIESGMNTSNTVIWIKTTSLSPGASTVFMYYGNNNAPAAANGSNTFDLFDDFSAPTLDASKWTVQSSSGSYTLSGGNISINTGSNGNQTFKSIASFSTTNTNYYSEMNVLGHSGNWPSIAQLNAGTFNGQAMFAEGGTNMHCNNTSAGCNTYTSFFRNTTLVNGIGIWKMGWAGNTDFRNSWPGGSANYTSVGSPASFINVAFGVLCSGAGSLVVDWIRLRKFAVAGDPVVTSGSEISNNPVVPSCVTTILPVTNSLVDQCPLGGTFSWNISAAADYYNLYLGTTYTLQLRAITTQTSIQLPLNPNTKYYWRIVSVNTLGAATGCPIDSFYTAPSCSCTPNHVNGSCSILSSYNFSAFGINYASGCQSAPAYTSVTSQTGNAFAGTSYPFSFSGLSTNASLFIYVDLNNNGIFNDVNETIYANGNFSSFSGNLTIPAATTPGYHRMRVHINYNGFPSHPCASVSGWGDTRDYLLNVLAPVNVAVSGPTTFCAGSSVTLTASGGTNYVWSNGVTTAANTITTTGIYSVTIDGIVYPSTFPVTVNTFGITQSLPNSFTNVGSTFISGGTHYLTTSTNQAGAMWSNFNISLLNDFDLNFSTYQCGLADGMVFVLQNGSNNVGPTGSNLGYYFSGAFPQSLAVELDIFNSGTPYNDADNSHLAIVKNGLPAPLVPTVPISPVLNNCNYRAFRITWDHTAHVFAVYIDNVLKATYSDDIVANIFGNNPNVRFGFTAGTGASGSTEAVFPGTMTFTSSFTPIIFAATNPTICQGGAATLQYSGIPPSSYLWSNGATTNSTTVTSAGNYTLRIAGSNGCLSPVSNSIPVVVNPIPTISASGSTSICSGNSLTLSSSLASGNLWSSGETTQNITVSSTANYTVTVNNCVSAATSVTVIAPPVISQHPTDPAAVCGSFSGTLAAAATGTGLIYQWESSLTGAAGTWSTVTVNTPNTGVSYTNATSPSLGISGLTQTCYYRCSISNTCPAVETNAAIVTVNPIPVITPGGSSTICEGNTITLTSTPASGITWNTGETTQNITVSAAGNYSVSTATCTSNVKSVTVNTFSITSTVNSNYNRVGSAGGGGTSYSITTGDGQTGAIWNTTQVSLDNDFDFSFTTRQTFGNSFASGLVFVLQNTSSVALGGTFDNLGYYNGPFSQSLAVELDIKNSGAGAPYYDNSDSHIAIVKNGSALPLVGPVIISPALNNDVNRPFRVTWNHTSHVFSVYEDNILVASYTDDIITNIFNNNPNVYFGFTGACGGNFFSHALSQYVQHVSLTTTMNSAPSIYPSGPTTFCQGSSVNLSSSVTAPSYLWSNGSTSSSLNNLSLSGNYSLSVAGSNGCFSQPSNTITVVQNIPATISCVSDQTIGTDVGNCSAVLLYSPSVAGSPVPAISYSLSGATTGNGSGNASGLAFNKGTTTVTLNANNSCGGESCSFTVTVNDDIAPLISCNANPIIVNTTPGNSTAIVNLIAPIATDNCSVPSVSSDHPSSLYAIGTNTVTWTATDGTGNTASCSQDVIVLDSEDPTLACTSNISVANEPGTCGAVVNYPTPLAGDNSSGTVSQTLTYTGSLQTFSVPAGVSRLTIQAAGAKGGSNLGNGGDGAIMQGSFAVSPGQQLQVVVGGQGGSGYGNGGGGGTFVISGASLSSGNLILVAGGGGGAGDITNGCAAAPGFPGLTGTTGGNSEQGRLGGLNGHGGESAFCCDGAGGGGGYLSAGLSLGASSGQGGNALINGALGGNGASGFSAGAGGYGGGGGGGNRGGGGGGGYSGGAGDVNSGGCGQAGGGGGSYNTGTDQVNAPGVNSGDGYVTLTWQTHLTLTQTAGLASGATFPVGTTTNTFVVSDSSGNTATCSFTVMVNDTEAPILSCSDIEQCSVNVVNYSSNASDNCGIQNVVYSIPNGSVFPSGTTTVTATATDIHGNTASCNFDVTISPPPVAGTAIITTTILCPGVNSGGFITTNGAVGTVGWEINLPNDPNWYPIFGMDTLYLPTPTLADTGTYTLHALVASGSCSPAQSNDVQFTVIAPPDTSVLYANGSVNFCEGGSVTLSGNTNGGEWNTLETSPSITVISSGTYYVTNSNTCGTVKSDSITVTISPTTLSTVNVTQAAPYVYGFENALPPALFCGMTLNNDNFPPDAEQWHTSAIAPHSGNNHMAIHANVDGVTQKDDWFFTAPLNLSAGKLYRLSFWYRGTNPAKSEQLDIYAGSTPYSFDMLSGAAIFTRNNIQNVTYVNDSAADFIAPFTGTFYFGFYAHSSANQGSLYIDDIALRETSVNQLMPSSCTTLNSMYDQIFCTPVVGAVDYKYKIENQATSFSYEYTRNLPLNDFRLKWAPGVLYGMTYDVSTSYKKNGVWSVYGASCPVTMGPFPTTKLKSGSCGSTIASLNDVLYADTIPGATNYEYRIINTTLGYDYTWQRGTAQSDYRLSWAYSSSPFVQGLPYGYTYDVEVRAQVGKTSLLPGQWGTFGPVCQVNVSGTPGTQLTPSYCGAVLSSFTTKFYCIPVAGASEYEYRVSNAALGYSQIGTRANSSTDYQFNWLPNAGGGIKYNTTYNVEVRAKVGGVFSSFGNICQVTTPASLLTSLQAPFCSSTLPTFSSTVNCIAVPGATNYRYHITGPLGYDKTFMRNSPLTDWKFSWTLLCCGQQNMLANLPYSVEVASYAGGVWSAYGPACTITTSASVPRHSEFDAEILEESAATLGLSIFPNPVSASEQFAIQLKGINSANEKIQLNVYNLLGEKVYCAEIITREESTLTIRPEAVLLAGVYLVEAQVNGKTFKVKFVVN